ncbi:hypothetical protein HPB49_010659 [Dermacentor silvarum]|uniref:Uncharacterized protein n=1 Tax=Dermacentor silvarum TaxID=543639 RepID=A0ACB8D550_DERSI|nr:hypothetical protein HPB49_010659 [Dermacentor silvarum]
MCARRDANPRGSAGASEANEVVRAYVASEQGRTNLWRRGLPPFWVDWPEVWFAQVDAQFSLARITQDRTRYDCVVTHLDARDANELRDTLANPPTANLYEHLKPALIRHLSLSEEQKIRQLQSAELAERKPSQLLRHMRALAGNMQVHDSFLRALWLQRLPPHVQAILEAQVRLPLNELVEIADRVIEASLPQLSRTIQAVAAPLNTTELARRNGDIDRQLTCIQQRLGERLPMQQRCHLQSRDLNTTSSRQPDNNGPCYYHRRFWDRARQCRPPCPTLRVVPASPPTYWAMAAPRYPVWNTVFRCRVSRGFKTTMISSVLILGVSRGRHVAVLLLGSWRRGGWGSRQPALTSAAQLGRRPLLPPCAG